MRVHIHCDRYSHSVTRFIMNTPCTEFCFEKASLKGMVGGGGIDAANTAEDYVDIMKKAYELGKNL